MAYAALVYGYLTLTPAWQNPDEPAHFNYVAFVAQTGELPELKEGDWDAQLLERLKTGTLQPTDSIDRIRYESWQPPLFYLLAAPVYKLGPADPSAQLLRLRALNAVIGAVTLIVTYQLAREALQPDLALSVPLVLVGVPMFTAVSAALSADPLANLLAASTLLQLVRRLRSKTRGSTSTRWPITAGVFLGLGLLTKLALVIFVPLALIVIALRANQKLRESTILIAALAIVVAPWIVHQVTTYGPTDPLAIARHSAVVADQPRFPGLSPDYVVQFVTISFHSFWAQFGWMAIVATERLYWIWGILTVLGAAGLILARHQFKDPVWQLLAATIVLSFVAYVGYNLSFQQFQGRYLFTALAPLAVVLVAGWGALPPKRFQPRSVLALGLVLVALNAYALTRVLVPGFAPSG